MFASLLHYLKVAGSLLRCQGQAASPAPEPADDGRAPSVLLWTGAAGDGQFTTPSNWIDVRTGAPAAPAPVGE